MVTYPSDWRTYPFKKFFRLIPNNTLSRDKLSSSGTIGNIHYGDVLIKYGDTISDQDDIPRVREDIDFVANNLLQKNDVIVADTAEDETVGKVTQVGDVSIPLVGGLHTVVCRPNIETADGYLGCYMNSRYYHDQLLPYITGIKVSSVSKKSLNETEITIPNDIQEQKAIVSIFNDMDRHISNITELIEKKRGIRDGALEDLMSCRTRLGGYSEDWCEVSLSDICKIYDGTHQTPKYASQGIRFVSVENITNIYGSEKYISFSAYETGFKVYPEKGDILMTRIGDIGTPCIVETDEPLAYYVSLALFKNIKINSRFLDYYIISSAFQKELEDRTLHHATPKKINKGEIGKCKVMYPKDTEEQGAISDILRVMDEEIEALEIEQDKMIQIREGAMDDLLTGRVRLSI